MSRKFIVLFWLNGKQTRKKFNSRDDAVKYAHTIKRTDNNLVGVYDSNFYLLDQFYVC